jgi:hypothetical protein
MAICLLGFCVQTTYAAENGIYDAIFSSDNGDCPVFVADHTPSNKGLNGLVEWSASEFARLLSMDLATAQALVDENKTSHTLNWQPRNPKIHLIEFPDDTDMQAKYNILTKLRKEHACVHTIYSASAPGLSAAGNDAMMMVHRFCGAICGGGDDILHLHKDEAGHWAIAGWHMMSIN